MTSIAVVSVILDQVTKSVVRATLAACPDGAAACDRVLLIGPFDLLRTSNPGSALGLAGPASVLPLIIAAALLLVAEWRLAPRTMAVVVGLGLQAGGLVGGAVDRLIFHEVTDFLHLSLDGSPRGVVANVADLALIVGGCLVAVEMVRQGSARSNTPLPGPSL
ncbi:MAG: signal peptidase II [Chloroflexi bacterium]|nr:signal peptidase II [Chloroflexota bacterium]